MGKQKGDAILKPYRQTTRNKILAHLRKKTVFCLSFPIKPGPRPIPEIIVDCSKEDCQAEGQVETDRFRANILKEDFLAHKEGCQIDNHTGKADSAEFNKPMPYQSAKYMFFKHLLNNDNNSCF